MDTPQPRSRRAIKTPKRFDDEAYTPSHTRHHKEKEPPKNQVEQQAKPTPEPVASAQPPKSIIKVKLNKALAPKVATPKASAPKIVLPKEPTTRTITPKAQKEAVAAATTSTTATTNASNNSTISASTVATTTTTTTTNTTTSTHNTRPKTPKRPRTPPKAVTQAETLAPPPNKIVGLSESLVPNYIPRITHSRPKTRRPRTPPTYTDLIPNVVLPFWDARTAAEEHEDDNVKELVHCHCAIAEEVGLMVQCEICLTWQHAHCLGIERAEDAPDNYTCLACSDPRYARESMRWAYDQDWLTKGRMKKFPCDSHPIPEKNVNILCKINQMIGRVLHIHQVIHSLRVKQRILLNAGDDDFELKLFRNHLDGCGGGGGILESSVVSTNKDVTPDECRANLRLHIQQTEEFLGVELAKIEEQLGALEKECEGDGFEWSIESLRNDLITMKKYTMCK